MTGREPHPLRAALEALGGPLHRWTVMAHTRDPFRMDTPQNNANSRWLLDAIAALRISFPIHIRGIHYVLVSVAGVATGSRRTLESRHVAP
jgi:hypothetical protein